jgi:hypothetical protein
MISKFKSGQDAVVQAKLLKDDNVDNLVIGDINIEVDPERAPLTIIELTEVKPLKICRRCQRVYLLEKCPLCSTKTIPIISNPSES